MSRHDSDDTPKPPQESVEAADTDSEDTEADDRDAPPPRVSRHIQPLGPRVLVRILKSPDRLESGLYLPAGSKDDNAEALLGEVIEVARTMPKTSGFVGGEEDEDEPHASLGANVSGIPVGSQILFSKEKGVTVPWDDTLRLLSVRYILAIVDTITQDKLQ